MHGWEDFYYMRRLSQSEHWFLLVTRAPTLESLVLAWVIPTFQERAFWSTVLWPLTSGLLQGSLALWVEVTASQLESTVAAIFHWCATDEALSRKRITSHCHGEVQLSPQATPPFPHFGSDKNKMRTTHFEKRGKTHAIYKSQCLSTRVPFGRMEMYSQGSLTTLYLAWQDFSHC